MSCRLRVWRRIAALSIAITVFVPATTWAQTGNTLMSAAKKSAVSVSFNQIVKRRATPPMRNPKIPLFVLGGMMIGIPIAGLVRGAHNGNRNMTFTIKARR